MYIYNQQFFKKYSSSYKNILQIIISIKIMLIEHFFFKIFYCINRALESHTLKKHHNF